MATIENGPRPHVQKRRCRAFTMEVGGSIHPCSRNTRSHGVRHNPIFDRTTARFSIENSGASNRRRQPPQPVASVGAGILFALQSTDLHQCWSVIGLPLRRRRKHFRHVPFGASPGGIHSRHRPRHKNLMSGFHVKFKSAEEMPARSGWAGPILCLPFMSSQK